MASPHAPGTVKGIFTVIRRTSVKNGALGFFYKVSCSLCGGEHLRNAQQIYRQICPDQYKKKKHYIKVGDRYGRLVVTQELPKKKDLAGYLRRLVKAKCGCGDVRTYRFENLYSGTSTQCRDCADYERGG